MAMELMPGTIFAGDFRVVRLLSDGGMGSVYVVEQLSTGAQRALKLMHRQFTSDQVMRRRFEVEARIGARIESDHVVHVVGAGVEGESGMPWLAMELLEGENLKEYVRRVGPLSPHEVRIVFEQLCHAVGAAHAAGIVHRDLKPDNVFLARLAKVGTPYEVKVLDFGIAKLTTELTGGGESANTDTIGTPAWMAPEQMELGAAIVPATDVWALGLIAFHLLTGRTFWRSSNVSGGSSDTLLREIVLEPIPAASARAIELSRSQHLPHGFDAWFERCLARDHVARFSDARAAWAALEPILAAEPSELAETARWSKSPDAPTVAAKRSAPPPAVAPVTGPPLPAPPPAPPAPRAQPSIVHPPPSSAPSRPPMLVAGAAVVIALAAGAVAVRRFSSSGEPARPPPASVSSPAPTASAEPTPAPILGDLVDDRPMVHVPGGTFSMGSKDGEDDERPVHPVMLQPFDVDQTEVTVAAYRACVDNRRCTEPYAGDGCNYGAEGRETHPVNCVDWNQATAFCKAHGKRLLTEEEWELSARGTKGGGLYPWGSVPPSKQRLCWNGEGNADGKGKRTSTCAAGTPDGDRSPYGVLGLAGNVAEWTASRYCPYPIASCSSPERVVRGATWVDFAAVSFRATYRGRSAPSGQSPTMGFRCARTP